MTRSAPVGLRSGKAETMVNARGLGRLGLLAMGLGIGAALASTPGVASADSSTDPFSWIGGIDLGDLLSAPAQTTSALDMQVSIDGFDLFPTAGNTATATSSLGDIAIAIGNGSHAEAGFYIFDNFDSAFADGTNSTAVADTGSLNTATALGDGSFAGAEGGSLDTATALGTGSAAEGDNGILDTATALGTNTSAVAVSGNGDLVTALGTNSAASAILGSNDLAFVLGTGSTADTGAGLVLPLPGNFDLAAAFGDMLHAVATGGNFLIDIPPLPLL
jgi:hypothetical protein